MPSVRLAREAERVQARARTGMRRRPRHTGGPCGPPITSLACVGVTLGAAVTTAPIDAPDLLGSRGGLGTLVRMWQACLSRCRGMGLCD